MGRPPSCHCHCTPTEPPEPGLCPCPKKGSWEQFQVSGVNGGGKERLLVMQICNSNSARDDNMKIILNGTTIDEVLDHNSNSRTGAIYVSHVGATISDLDNILVCPGENHEQISFDPNILNAWPTNNAVTAETVQENNNGNYGRIVIASFPYPYVKDEGCIILDQSWGYAEKWNYQFSLCPPVAPVNFVEPDQFYLDYTVEVDGKIYKNGESVNLTIGESYTFSLIGTENAAGCQGEIGKFYGPWRGRSPATGGQGDSSGDTALGAICPISPFQNSCQCDLTYTIPANGLDIWPEVSCVFA